MSRAIIVKMRVNQDLFLAYFNLKNPDLVHLIDKFGYAMLYSLDGYKKHFEPTDHKTFMINIPIDVVSASSE